MKKLQNTSLSSIRSQLRTQVHADENLCVEGLLSVCDESPWLTKAMRDQAQQQASEFVENCRAQGSKHNILDAFFTRI